MDSSEFLQELKKEAEKVFNWFSDEIKTIRTSRVSIDLIDDVLVDYFGQKLPLKELASLVVVDSRTLSIEPWDKRSEFVSSIEKALSLLDWSGQIKVVGDKIYLSMPTMTEENRRKFVKILKDKKEKAKIVLRDERDRVWKEVQIKEREGEIGEDEKYRLKDKIQEIVDEVENKIEDLASKKEKEIMEQ
ncbi:MAG: ribosome recycling factor [Candidatus Pacebacteria bacterium]|nr:ribosome recycling factor [Candidatus Paceibacterota bacterium]